MNKKNDTATAEATQTKQEIKQNKELAKFFAHDNQLDYEIILYRWEGTGPKKKKYFVDDYDSTPPSRKDIAKIHGPGDYVFWAVDPISGELKTMPLYIGEEWRRVHEEYKREQEALTAPARVPSDSKHVDAFDQLDKLSIIMERMRPSTPTNPFEGMPGFISSMGKSYVDSMAHMGKGMLEMQLANMQKMNEEKEEEEPQTMNEEEGIQKEIVGLISTWIKTLMNSKGEETENLKKIITEDERFKKVKDNQKVFSGIYSDLCHNKKVGKKIAGEVFKKFGFKVPA